MNVPIKVIERGGDFLREYIIDQKEIEELKITEKELEAKIKLHMIRVYTNLSSYLPMENAHTYRRIYDFEDDFNEDELTTNHISPNILRSKTVIGSILIAEQLLNDVKHLILERKATDKKLDELREAQNERLRKCN